MTFLVKKEKATATHCSTLAWKIPWTEEPVVLQSMGWLRVGHDWVPSLSRIGEGNGNPLQCSCLENPRDRGVWWAAVYGVAQSQTWLKWLSSNSSSWLRNTEYNISQINLPVLGLIQMLRILSMAKSSEKVSYIRRKGLITIRIRKNSVSLDSTFDC